MSERGREQSIAEVRHLLERAGFYVGDAHSIRPTSFDLVARRDALLLVLKVLKNIDALDPEEARRLKELHEVLVAVPLVVGETSGGVPLDDGVVYSRHGVPILSQSTLAEYLEEGVPPFLFSSPGGIFARIDGPRLRHLREERHLSLGALASAAGVSRRTIQLYEEGAGAEVTVVERLEEFLGDAIARPIELLRAGPRVEGSGEGARARPAPTTAPETGDALRDVVLRGLGGMGWQVTVTIRCPFDAISWSPTGVPADAETLLTSVGSLRSAQHRAEVLLQLARVMESHALYVVREAADRASMEGLPILSVREFRRHRDPQELLDALQARAGP